MRAFPLKIKLTFTSIVGLLVGVFFIGALILGYFYLIRWRNENKILKEIIDRLSADSRIAEVIVTKTETDQQRGKTLTTIKFVEYDAKQQPLPPKYFTFSGNIIQFQSLVIRFDDYYVKTGHPLKGKSAYLFMKAFSLQDKQTEVFEITPINEIPEGYKVSGTKFEKKLWENFWKYALDPKFAKSVGIKNAQIEAPGTKFVPGIIYTIKIEHDGGMRIDAKPVPQILRGEKLDF